MMRRMSWWAAGEEEELGERERAVERPLSDVRQTIDGQRPSWGLPKHRRHLQKRLFDWTRQVKMKRREGSRTWRGVQRRRTQL